MQGSCILSASILIVIAGITANSLPTSQPYPLAHYSSNTVASSPSQEEWANWRARPWDRFSLSDSAATTGNVENRQSISRVGSGDSRWSEDDPLWVLLSDTWAKSYLVTERVHLTERLPIAASSKRMAIYPQPLVSDLSRKPVPILKDFSRQRRVALQATTETQNLLTIKDLLPAVHHFLAMLSQHLPLSDDAETAEIWVQAPYFQHYGYRYVMDDHAGESDDTVETATSSFDEEAGSEDPDTGFTRPVPDFVLNPIDGWITPNDEAAASSTDEYEETVPTEESEEASIENEVLQESSTNAWFGFHVTPKEWFGDRDAGSWFGADSEEETGDVEGESYEKGQKVAYRSPYGSNHSDYAIEYETYEDDIYRPRQTREQVLADTSEESEATTPDSKSSDLYDIDYEPLREEADYYHEEEAFFSPHSSSSGNFDIYWELTNPQTPLIILK